MEMIMEVIPEIRRPVMSYPGGKFRIADWLVSHYPIHKFYVGAYFGAGSDFFQKPRSGAEIINDVNGDIVNVFKVLRNKNQAAELEHLLRLTPFAYDEYTVAYLPTDDPVERARRTIFRSFASIGTDGVFRDGAGFRGLKNREDGLTTAHEWANYFDTIHLFTERLQGVIIENRDALKVIKTYDSKFTFTYADPPYLKSARGRKRDLYANELGKPEEEEAHHRELAKLLHEIKGTAVVSHYDCPLYDELYGDWRKESIASRKMGNEPAVECIWIHPRIQLQNRMF